MNKWTKYGVIGGAVAIASSVSTWVAISQVSYDFPTFTYDLVQTSYQSADGISNTRRQTIGMRSDGSKVTVNRYTLADGTTYNARTIVDLTSRRQYVVNDGVGTKATSMISQEAVDRARKGPGANCGAQPTAMKSTWQSYDVVVNIMRVEDRGQGQTRELELWLAPSLGCATVKMFERLNGQVRHSAVAENIVIGEPLSSLFSVPSSYVEASPAETARRVHEKLGGPPGNPNGEIEKRAEETYMQRRRELEAERAGNKGA